MANQSGEALWWQRGVIYQVYPRSFKDANGDGIGDLRGVIERLDYLADDLGIDVIWLSPIYPSPMADFGYDVSDYTDINPMFGSLSDFDTLVAEAHKRGLRVVIDFVPNHCSDQHPWFVESRSSRDNPKRDWFFWRDPGTGQAAKPDGGLPNNWLSVFGGPAWEWDETTGQYYLHSFLKEQPDLNWRNPEVKAAMFDAIRFWLKRDVDGFRIDVAHFIMKDPDLRDNPPSPVDSSFKPMGDYGSLEHVHDMAHPDVHGVFRELRALLDSYSVERPRFSVGEIHIFDWWKWAAFYGEKLDELHMPYNFALIFAKWSPAVVGGIIAAVEKAVPPGGWPNYVLGNHDEHRLASRVGADAARVAMMMLLTLRGTPTLYYGDEIGMHDVEIPPELEQDSWGKRVPGQNVGRDPERTPMQWDAGPNAGFGPEDSTPWLPLADDYQSINVEAQKADPKSMLSFTHALLALRRETPALYKGSYTRLGSALTRCLAYMREAGDERYLVALNFTSQPQSLGLPDMGLGTVVLSTHMDQHEAGPATIETTSVSLRANEGLIIKLG